MAKKYKCVKIDARLHAAMAKWQLHSEDRNVFGPVIEIAVMRYLEIYILSYNSSLKAVWVDSRDRELKLPEDLDIDWIKIGYKIGDYELLAYIEMWLDDILNKE
jgi:hypothetical protein